MLLKIALAGNPNSGKTTMFNDLTGSNQYVGNWPGVTVEKKEGKLKIDKSVVLQDLPGIYSLSPYTLEEVVARNYLINEQPDAIINIIDGTNIERNMYLTTQLIELGIPTVVAINMMDLVRKNGDKIDIKALSNSLGCEVIETSALKKEGSESVARKAIEIAKAKKATKLISTFEGAVEHAIAHIEESIQEFAPENTRWYAVKIFERDEKVLETLNLSKELMEHLEKHIVDCENELDDDSESIITNERYTYITKVIDRSVKKKKKHGELTISDRIDKIVTNRMLGLPIFVGIMWFVYYVSMAGGGIGDTLTGWTNDTFFGEIIVGNLESFMQSVGAADWLVGLVGEGIVGGVGAVLGFVPQMLLLFLMLSILEDIGYMARVAFIMDRIFRKFGLSGKSFIPMLIGSGCSVPGIMASRTIESEKDRRMTIMTTSFIPCGAKMPIIGLFAGALFGGSGLVATSAYFIGVIAIIFTGIMLKKTKWFAGKPTPFVMELPAYHVPSVSNVLHSTWERGWSFIKRAGTIILASSIVLWFLQGYGIVDGVFAAVEDNNTSLLADIGRFVAPIFAPIGFGHWQAAVATFTGLIAKEEVVSTFGVLYGFGEISDEGQEFWPMIAADFTAISAYSFMVFNMICIPCFAAIGAIKREMNSTKWTLFAIGYQCGFAYLLSLITYQIVGLFIGQVTLGIGTVVGALALLVLLYFLFRPNRYLDEDYMESNIKVSLN